MKLEDILKRFDDKAFDHKHSGHGGSDEVLVFSADGTLIVLYFWNGVLTSGMTCQQGTTTFYTGDTTSIPLLTLGIAA